MAVVEDLIVAMGFDNKQFEAAVKISMATLGQLKQNMNFGGQKNGIDQMADSAAKFNAAPMLSGADQISAKFLAMSTIAITALSNIVNKAVDAGLNVAKAFTVAPVAQGFEEYETKIGSIQTILSNTAQNYGSEEEALGDITKNLEELNKYADLTIYNFADMTKNIGLFTNAGIGVESATKMIKGFSNEAAASGTSAEKAAGAAQQLSQGLSTGVVTAQDWISLTTAGMGSTNMKNGIVEIAEAMGAFEGKGITATEAAKDFKGSLEKKWLSADVMETYLNIQAEGEESVNRAMMEQIGLSKEQQDAFIERQKMSQDAAQEVRTFTQLMGTLKEGVGSSWAKTTEILLGDFTNATKLFSGIYRELEPMLGAFGESRNALLEGWAAQGGRESALAGLKNIFDSLMSVIRPISQAFRDIFPAQTVSGLLSLTQAFERFTEKLVVGYVAGQKIRRIFAGIFAIFGIGWEVVKAIFGVFADLFGVVSGGSGGFLNLAASIGDFLVRVHEAIKGGGLFAAVFETIGKVLAAPIQFILNLGSAIGSIIGDMGNATALVTQFWDALVLGDTHAGPLGEEDSPIIGNIYKVHQAFKDAASIVEQFWNIMAKGDFVGGFFEEDSAIVDFLFDIRESIESFFSSDGLKAILGGAAGVGLGFAIKAMVSKAFGIFTNDNSLVGKLKGAIDNISGAFESVSGILDSVTDSFKAMQQNLQAGTLLKIGLAIGIVAISLKLLSTIEGKDLAIAMGGVVGAMTSLLAGMAVLSKISGTGGLAAMPVIAVALMGLATAILILTAAVKVLSTMSWQELLLGLGGLAGIMAILVAGAYGLSKAEGPMLRAGLAMIPMAAAIKILVSAVQDLGATPWDEMLRGLGGLAGIMAVLAAGLNLMPKNMPSIGFGLVLVSAGLAVIGQVIQTIGEMNTAQLVQGIIGIGGGLAVIAGALHLMPADMPTLAGALLVLAGALLLIGQAVQTFADMSWGDMAQGMIGLGGSLAILAVGLNAIAKAEGGAEAIAVAAGGLILLMIPLKFFSEMSWEELIKGLLGLAGVFAVLGAAGYLLGPLMPVLSSLGIAMALVGVGIGAIGLGAIAFASAIKIMIEIANMGQDAIVKLMQLIPQMAASLATGITAFLTTLADNAGAIATAFGELLGGLLDTVTELIPKIQEVFGRLLLAIAELIIQNAPKIAEAFLAVISSFLRVINEAVPAIIDTVFNLMMSFLQTVRDRIPDIVTVVADIIIAFIGALQQKLPDVIQAGFDFIIGFMNGLAEAIRNNMPLVFDAAANIGTAIVEGVIKGIGNVVERLYTTVKDMAKKAIDAAVGIFEIASPSKVFTRIGGHVVQGLINGIDNGKNNVARAGEGMAQGLIGTVNSELGKLGGTAKTVFDIFARGDFTRNGGFFEEDSPIVDQLFNIREGFLGIGGAVQETMNIIGNGEFTGVGPWTEDSGIVSTLFDIREGMVAVGGAAETAWGIMSTGDFKKGSGPWEEDSPIVDVLFDIREGMEAVGGAAGDAWDILNKGDFEGKGPWSEDSPIVDTLFKIREGFEEFQSVGENAVQGVIVGFQEGTGAFAEAAKRMAEEALQAARDALGIKSPSKKFQQIGEYSIDGLLTGLKSGDGKVNGQGKTIANGLVNGFSKGLGKEMPKAFASVFETLKTGAADAKFWGPNNPITTQLQGLNAALKEADLRLAAFYGEVNMADPASIEAYAQSAGQSLKYLTGLLNGMEKAANRGFEMLESGKGLDKVLGDEEVLNDLLDGILSVIPGVEAMFVRLGFAVVDGFLGLFFNTSVMGIVGKFITWAVQQIGGLFGIEFPIEEELDDANKELEDFLVNVEDTQGRFEKLSDAGVASLTDTLTEANDAVDAIDKRPVITPVLDLTEYNKAKGGMNTSMPNVAFTPTQSAAQAGSIWDTRNNLLKAAQQTAQEGLQNVQSLIFNQSNNSPLPLSHVEIYKNTKGLLANAKEALGIR